MLPFYTNGLPKSPGGPVFRYTTDMKLVGIIDIGSNSMRLSVIRRLDNGAHYVVDEHKSTPRLASLVAKNGELGADAVNELLIRLREFMDLARAYGVGQIVALGTAALRGATNRDQVVATVARQLGITIDIVSGKEEAYLGYTAVRRTLEVETAYLIDIGGGSTEISLVKDGELAATHSLPFGAVTIMRHAKETGRDLPTLKLPDFAAQALQSLDMLHREPHAEVIGIGGTIRSVARIHQGARSYPLALAHNYVMPPEDVEAILHWIASLPLQRRKKINGLSKDRVDLIIPGGTILLHVLRQIGACRLRVSGRGLRDGAFYARVLQDPDPASEVNILEQSVHNLLRRFLTSEEHAGHVSQLAFALFNAFAELKALAPTADRVLYTAAMLHRIGVHVSYYGYDRHTFYLILCSPIYGLSHREILLAALAASFKGRAEMRTLAVPYRSLLTEGDEDMSARLGVLVRLAEAMDQRREQRITSLVAKVDKESLNISLTVRGGADVEIAAALALAPQMKKIFGRDLAISIAELFPENQVNA